MKVCLITPGQPSNNPRLVKESDALTAAGHTVRVICADCGLWPSRMDAGVLERRSWTCVYAAATDNRPSALLRRLRHRLSRAALEVWPDSTAFDLLAISPVASELRHAAMRDPADLYIAHHLVALPAAINAAKKHGARVGYDVEDLYTEMRPFGTAPNALDRLWERTEERYVRSCDYVTAAAPGMADAYARRYAIKTPTVVLNVFPLDDKPAAFRASDPAEPLRLYWFSQCIGDNRGLEDVVRAIGMLPVCAIELHLRGNWLNGYREKLLGLAAEEGIASDRIISHHPGPPDEMVRLAALYDVGLALEQPVSMNKDLCISNKIFVYLLAGNAVAATHSAGQDLLSTDLRGAGLFYQPGNIAALATAIQEWSTDRSRLNAARLVAWELGVRKYNWDAEQRTFLGLIEEVLQGQNQKPSQPTSQATQ